MLLIIYYFITIINISFCFFLIKKEHGRKNPFALLWLSLSIIFFIPSLADPFMDISKSHLYSVIYDLNIENLIFSQIYALLWMFLYYLITSVLFKTCRLLVGGIKKNQQDNIIDNLLYLLIILVSFLSIVYYLFLVGFHNGFEMDFLEFRESIPLFLRIGLIYTQYFICGIAAYYFSIRKFYIASLCACYLVILFLFIGGSRQPLAILALTTIYMVAQNSKYGFLYYFAIIIASPILIFCLQVLLELRNIHSFDERIGYLFNGAFLSSGISTSSEQNLRFAYYYFVENFKNLDGFFEFSYFSRTLLAWFPSFYSEGIKPSDFEVTMFEAYMPGYTGTMHPLMFGSTISDTGYMIIPWVFLISFIVFISNLLLNKFTGKLRSIYLGVMCSCAVMYARGAIYGISTLLLYSSVVLIVVHMLGWCTKKYE